MKIKALFYSAMVHFANLFPDKFYIKRQFRHMMHYSLNLKNPITFQEKLQWIKLYDHREIYTSMVDKFEAKNFIAKVIGNEYVIPTIAVYDKAKDIDYDILPISFVMKTTHDSGTVIICKNKAELDIAKANLYLNKRLKRKYYLKERELQYKDVKPRIIVEKLIGEPSEDVKDYKFYCFNGEPKLMFIVSNRFGKGGHKADFFDMNKKKVAVFQPGFESNPVTPELPPVFDEMKELAAKLSKGVPHVRVDFYYTHNQIFVGELTLFDAGGYLPFYPDEYNKILGDWINLPILKK